jgi:hypothetical protein
VPTALSSIVDSLTCSCRSRRLRRRQARAWGYLTFFFETVAEQHLPGCPIAQLTGTNHTQKLGVRYTGLRRLLKSAIQISFAMQSGAGGRCISPSFTYYPTVDEKYAPAFRMMGMLDRALRAHSKTSVTFQWEELLGMALDKLLRLFQTNKASPFAVDSMNRSLLHYLAGLVSLVFTHARKVNSKTHLDSNPLIAAAELRAVFALAKRGSRESSA